MSKKSILIISDATGMTAEMVVRAALYQFKDPDVSVRRISYVRSEEKIIEAVKAASSNEGLIVHTLVSDDLRGMLQSEGEKRHVVTIDLLGRLLSSMSDLIGVEPQALPSFHREMDETYFRTVEAIEYTVNHDDGQKMDDLDQASIVIVGTSRTSKTPVSIFLSNRYSIKVANVPIVLGMDLPEQLDDLDQRKVVGLMIAPRRLVEIRKARMRKANWNLPSRYADIDHVIEELRYAQSIFYSRQWPVIDVTEKSVEETTQEILSALHRI